MRGGLKVDSLFLVEANIVCSIMEIVGESSDPSYSI